VVVLYFIFFARISGDTETDWEMAGNGSGSKKKKEGAVVQ
jgi:hypothetical protein